MASSLAWIIPEVKLANASFCISLTEKFRKIACAHSEVGARASSNKDSSASSYPGSGMLSEGMPPWALSGFTANALAGRAPCGTPD